MSGETGGLPLQGRPRASEFVFCPPQIRLGRLGLQPEGRGQYSQFNRRISQLLHVRGGPARDVARVERIGDQIVHDYLRAVPHQGRVGVLNSNKDYGCEWDYDWRNKRFQREDNTKFGVNVVVMPSQRAATSGPGASPASFPGNIAAGPLAAWRPHECAPARPPDTGRHHDRSRALQK
jgi:uncharacterized protein DUF4159